MAENKITLGQLTQILVESGINLNEIYLDEPQVQEIQDDLTDEQQKSVAATLLIKTRKLNDVDLANVGGGTWESAKKWLKNSAKAISIGVGLVSGGLLLASKLTDDIDIGVAFGKYKIIDPDNKWTENAQDLHDGLVSDEKKHHRSGEAFTETYKA